MKRHEGGGRRRAGAVAGPWRAPAALVRRGAAAPCRPRRASWGGGSSGVLSQLAEGGAERRDGAHRCGETSGGRRRWSSQTGERKSRRRLRGGGADGCGETPIDVL